MTDGTRRLAAELAALDDDALAGVLAARAVPVDARWRSFFDAAEALLMRSSLDEAFARLPAAALHTLSGAAHLSDDAEATDPTTDRGEHDALIALALVDRDGRPYPAVAQALRESAPRALRGDPVPLAATPPPAAPDAEEAMAAERVFTNTAALADLLLRTLRTPLARIGSGAVSAGERKRLTEELPRPDDLDALMELAVTAGLLVGEERAWTPTASAEEWLRRGTLERWCAVAEAWRDHLPAGVLLPRAAARRWATPTEWPHAYPADPAWPARAERIRAQAEAWGLLTPSGHEPSWSTALATGTGSAVEALRAVIPHEVDRVYLQNDLSAIAPGPLAPALDVRLRGMAHRESHAQASSYRFSTDSLGSALADGETEESILGFLSEISLTGVPQPLDYLVRQTARRHGSIRVAARPEGGARVSSDDAAVLDTLAVDQTLGVLGFVARDGVLESKVGRETVLWALVDAGYPAVAVDATGSALRLSRHRLGRSDEAAPPSYTELLRTLRAADPADADAAWLGRELEAAVRDRAQIELDVEMPDGSSRGFRLEATGLGGGRVRGRDLSADVERTLPVSLIRTLRRV